VLGIVENMSYFLCPSDGVRYDIFGTGGGQKEATRLGVPLLAQLPIDMPTREGGDAGMPVALKAPEENAVSAAFHDLAAKVRGLL
jgi:ATP-binding protein involved in chromosome partitioning